MWRTSRQVSAGLENRNFSSMSTGHASLVNKDITPQPRVVSRAVLLDRIQDPVEFK